MYIRNLKTLVVLLIFSIIIVPSVFADIYAPSAGSMLTFFILGNLFNAIIDAFFLYVFGLKSRRQILSVIIINIITWTSLILFLSKVMTNILLTESLIIILETLFIFIFNKQTILNNKDKAAIHNFKTMLLAVAFTNIFSFFVGTLIFSTIILGFLSLISR